MKINNSDFDLSRFDGENKGEGNISPSDIINEVEATKNTFKPIPHKQLLAKLLEKVVRVDFRALVYPDYLKIKKRLQELKTGGQANLDDEDEAREMKRLQKELNSMRLSKRHYKIAAIEEVLKLARQYHWGLCKRLDFIYLFNGAYWQLLDESELQSFLGKAGANMGITKWTADDEKFVGDLYRQFLYKAHLPEPQRDDNITFINLQNGTFEITPDGRKLRNFNRNDFITYQLPFEYNPEAQAPIFKAYLDTVLPDKERQNVLAEYLGYVFTRHLKLEKTLLLYGTGANGKSVFFEIVNALLGNENVSSYSLQSLTDDNGYHRAKIANSLVNYASEINGKLQTDHFKQLVSGEPVEARLPYGQPFVMRHYARLIFNCNELPKDVEHTNAYFRRFLIIPFDVTIPEDKQDKQLSNKIIESELSGVFNWVLDGLDRLLQQKKFTKCDAIQKQIEQYKKESDSVQMFLEDENYKPSLEQTEPLKDIYRMYKEYAIDSTFKPVSIRTFAKRLRGLKFDIERRSYGKTIFIEREK